MAELWIAAGIWVGTHLGISSTPIRGALVRVLGQGLYLLFYALVAAAALAYLIWVYSQAPRFDYLWMPDPDLYWVAKVTMPLAMILLVGGFMLPKSNADEAQGWQGEPARGVLRITRHPMQWAIIIWAIGHIIANGDTVSLVFFNAFLLLSFIGTFLMDHKRVQNEPDQWAQFAAVTSNLPFAALLAGRNRWAFREWLWPVVVGLGLYALAYYFHESFTGAIVV